MKRTLSSASLSAILALCLPGAGCGAALDDAGAAAGDTAHSAGIFSVPIQVRTAAGPVDGTSTLGMAKFLGIPYAQPPVGPLRFRPPVAPAAFTRPLDATRLGAVCPQQDGSGALIGDEDCLRLNVWSPQVAAGARLPVMVFIHGGSFVMGSGGEPLYDGSYVAGKGHVVVVTLNYRLGALGFLAHPALVAEDPHGSAGNYGLLDQQLALRWVQQNIPAFGGDAGNVTVWGESAGGASVCAHLFSPLSAGLFQRAISESGACLDGMPPLLDGSGQSGESAVSLGKRVAAAVGCQAAADVAACLRDQPVKALLSALSQPPIHDAHAASYFPNQDGWVLPRDVKDAARRGQVQRVPLLAGVNKDEGTIFTLGAAVTSRADLERLVRAVLPAHADALLALYPAAQYPDPKAALSAMFGDYSFVCHTRLFARLVAGAGPRVYFYHFTRANLTATLLGIGVSHAMELPFVFHNFPWPFIGNAEDQRISDEMIGYWTRFAATGDPNGAWTPRWPAMTAADEYLGLDSLLIAGSHLNGPICDEMEPWLMEP